MEKLLTMRLVFDRDHDHREYTTLFSASGITKNLALCDHATWSTFPGTEGASTIEVRLSSEQFPGASKAQLDGGTLLIQIDSKYVAIYYGIHSFVKKHFDYKPFFVSITPVEPKS